MDIKSKTTASGKTFPMSNNFVDKSCKSTVYITPTKYLDPVRIYFGGTIPFDIATEPSNPAKADKFWTKEDDALSKDWPDEAFLNPPYGKVMKIWTDKIAMECGKGKTVIALLPCGARFSTRYWQKDILQRDLTSICFVKGRIPFLRPDGTKAKSNPYDSAFYGFNVDPEYFEECFSVLGKVTTVHFNK